MDDVEKIGEILDKLLNVLEEMDVPGYEEFSREFGIDLLKYVAYLADKEGVNLGMEHSFDDLFMKF